MTKSSILPSYRLPIPIAGLQFMTSQGSFQLEAGGELDQICIGYHTFGKLNEKKDNVIWVCHALTANSDVSDWWAGVFGPGNILDPEKYFIVCANILGSCYGSTGARSKFDGDQWAIGMKFPLVTIRDQVNAHLLLMKHLDVSSISLCIGGSCGGHQAMEMAFTLGEQIDHLALLVASARETAWVIASHAAQRKAMEADHTLQEDHDWAGRAGLIGARAMALLHYRTFDNYIEKQTSPSGTLDHFDASSYVNYQGEKLGKRFYAQSYYHLTKTLDTHDIGRNRGGIEHALEKIKCKSLIIGMSKDHLIPPSEQKFLAQHMPNAKYVEIDSNYGHDGFLVETKKINQIVSEWLVSESNETK